MSKFIFTPSRLQEHLVLYDIPKNISTGIYSADFVEYFNMLDVINTNQEDSFEPLTPGNLVGSSTFSGLWIIFY